jgi:predicted ATP-dependent serine protease
MSPRLVCACCSRPWDPSVGSCGMCGATYPINLALPPPPAPRPTQGPPRIALEVPGIKVETLEGARDLTPIAYDAALSQAMGGVVPGMTILVWGLPGAGKSTLAAQLAASMVRAMKGVCYWLDMEQLNRSLIKACFTRTRSPTDRVRVISARSPRDPNYTPVTWRDALTAIPPSRRSVVVVDSLQTWAGGSHREQTALMKAAQVLGPTVLVISHANKKGEASGRSTNQHSGDANVTVGVTEITITKCRWSQCPRVLQRLPEPPLGATY